MMAIDTSDEENAAFLCGGKWYPCLILEKRPTGSCVVWPCAFCCTKHYRHRVLIPAGEKDYYIRTFPISAQPKKVDNN